MYTYPENEILKAAELYSNTDFDSIAFENKRVKSLLKYLRLNNISYESDSISCCQCTSTKSLYHFTYAGKDYFVWGTNTHPLSKRVRFSFKITS